MGESAPSYILYPGPWDQGLNTGSREGSDGTRPRMTSTISAWPARLTTAAHAFGAVRKFVLTAIPI